MQKIILMKGVSLLVGLLGGLISFMIVVLVEGALASFYPDFLFKDNPYYLLILLIPSLVEEAVKISVAKRLMDNFSPLLILSGVGLGFGFIEAVIANSQINLLLIFNLLPWVHLLFLGAGYIIARFYYEKRGVSLVVWITASVFLHWTYDILVYVFTKQA
ncbi:MAG: hypothetical protein V1690_00295 [Candidatus Moraniibacteriota bacterium]